MLIHIAVSQHQTLFPLPLPEPPQLSPTVGAFDIRGIDSSFPQTLYGEADVPEKNEDVFWWTWFMVTDPVDFWRITKKELCLEFSAMSI